MQRSERIIWCLVALSGAITVMVGAYAAHGLTARVSAELVHAAETGVRYQAWHTLAIMAVLVGQRVLGFKGWQWPVALWGLGMVAFSGSLYAMAMAGLNAGIVTPIGGVLLIAGWLMLAVAVLRSP
ncbi:DUF423 domain-containing protein [Halomonas citrativorans]|uniref:DUF423 domain-containing protein n=1 Tax=Halomonas citrativorans TaxID=2742612 RepID=A0ABR9F8S3_9GAMM|nr:DUF423 domain-containing protein [Halomonas citrativorans]MBE0402893.1 DUF423 domain-containing protein [Halomonas citrativorans]